MSVAQGTGESVLRTRALASATEAHRPETSSLAAQRDTPPPHGGATPDPEPHPIPALPDSPVESGR